MTPEEVKLWVELKHFNKRGYHFRRQAPLSSYVLDFVEYGQKLVVEVDGSQHGEIAGLKRDINRDQRLQDEGFRILRFWNIDINEAMNGVVLKIENALDQPPPPPSAAPPPWKGEDK